MNSDLKFSPEMYHRPTASQRQTHNFQYLFAEQISLTFRPTIFFELNSLFGIPYAGLHSYRTYHSYHCKVLNLNPAIHGSCFLFSKNTIAEGFPSSKVARGFTSLRTDDTASAGNDIFVQQEHSLLKIWHQRRNILGGKWNDSV